mmetsp:Transcript_35394/g.97693  ORF Transcript_35394/g.97693 Transcript_35394/m.97693 type:complete len:218 (-) Transcript_35394:783-1436(-)
MKKCKASPMTSTHSRRALPMVTSGNLSLRCMDRNVTLSLRTPTGKWKSRFDMTNVAPGSGSLTSPTPSTTSNVSNAFRARALRLKSQMSFLMLICNHRSPPAEKITMRPNHCSQVPMPSKVEPCSVNSGVTSSGVSLPGGNINLRLTPPPAAMGSLPATVDNEVQPAIEVRGTRSLVVNMLKLTTVPPVTCCSKTLSQPTKSKTTVTRLVAIFELAP